MSENTTKRVKLEAPSTPSTTVETTLAHLQQVPHPEQYAKLADLQVQHSYMIFLCHSSALAMHSKVLCTLFDDVAKVEWASGVAAVLRGHALNNVAMYLTLVHSPGMNIIATIQGLGRTGNLLGVAKLAHQLDTPLVLEAIDSYLSDNIDTFKSADPGQTLNVPLYWLPVVEKLNMFKTKAACVARVLGTLVNDKPSGDGGRTRMELADLPGCSNKEKLKLAPIGRRVADCVSNLYKTKTMSAELDAPSSVETILTHLKLVPHPEQCSVFDDDMFDDVAKEEWARGVAAVLAGHALNDVAVYLTLVHSPEMNVKVAIESIGFSENMGVAKLAHQLDTPLVLKAIDSYLSSSIDAFEQMDPGPKYNLPLKWLPMVENLNMPKTKVACMARVLGTLLSTDGSSRYSGKTKMELADLPGCSEELWKAQSEDTLLVLLRGMVRSRVETFAQRPGTVGSARTTWGNPNYDDRRLLSRFCE